MFPATCPCGHVGKSKRPTYYRCSYCYYTGRAGWNEDHAKKLRARAARLYEEAREFRRKATAFRKKHPRPSDVPDEEDEGAEEVCGICSRMGRDNCVCGEYGLR